MTKRNFSRLTLVAAMTASASAAAMFPPEKGYMAATIPFSFQAGEASMSAGEYLVRIMEGRQIEICEDGAYGTVIPASEDRSRTESKPNFRHVWI